MLFALFLTDLPAKGYSTAVNRAAFRIEANPSTLWYGVFLWKRNTTAIQDVFQHIKGVQYLTLQRNAVFEILHYDLYEDYQPHHRMYEN